MSAPRTAESPPQPAARSPVREGDRLPDGQLCVQEQGRAQTLSTEELFGGRTVIAFGLPGAFTPTCSTRHLPRYEELAPAFRQHGVDALYCIAVNDPFVMAHWGAAQQVREVRLLADPGGEFTRALGLLCAQQRQTLGLRSRRYSMLVRDRRIEKLFVEPDEPGDPYTVSDADTLFHHLAPQAALPPRIALVTKPDCPHSAHARELLDRRGLRYVDVTLPDAIRGRFTEALVGRSSAPQVFVDGQHIGGADELERFLAAQGAGAPASARPR